MSALSIEIEIARAIDKALGDWEGEESESVFVAARLSPLLNRMRATERAAGIRGAAEAVHAEARWQKEQLLRGAVQKSGAQTAVERLLVVEELLKQQADHWEHDYGEVQS